MKKALSIGAFILAMIFLAAGRILLPSELANAGEKKKFVKFSHQKHVNDVGVECETCHKEISDNTALTGKLIPDHSACQSCHEEELDKKCTFCHESDSPERVAVAPVRDLIINHKNHVGARKAKCVECHEGILKADLASDLGAPPMKACVTCHNGRLAANQCENCHKNLANLFPDSHTLTDFKKEHKKFTRLNVMDAQCQSCHSDNFCAQCHDGTNLTALKSAEQFGMLSPRTLGNDKAKALAGQNVHELNYRFTHGMDAKAKSSECQTCHNLRSFCNDCHENGTQGLGGALPASHKSSGFVIVGGYGSGGGRHAEQARRDIERCASCHDAEGAEPACIRCHSDLDGIKRTDPKTHPTDFMKSVKGEWHSEPGATCYACHADPNARPGGVRGKGFCGYCHA